MERVIASFAVLVLIVALLDTAWKSLRLKLYTAATLQFLAAAIVSALLWILLQGAR